MEKINNKAFYLPILILVSYLVYRFYDLSKIIKYFPLDNINDYPPHIAQLYFLAEYGFHSIVPYWFNGFKLFLLYPPGWNFFTYPIYLITNNLKLATFISVLSLFIIILITLLIFGNTQKFSKTKSFAFFILLFANTLAIGNYIRLGRVSELYSLTFFVIISCIVLYYKNKDLDWKFFILFTPSYSALLLGHPSTTIITQIIILSLFLIKKFKEKLIVIGSIILSLIITSFWWYPFITNLSPNLTRADFSVSKRLLDFSGIWIWDNIGSFIISAIFLLTFIFYIRSQFKKKQEFIFFSPILLLNLLFLTRLVVFIPLLKDIYPDVYMMFFLFFSIFFLLKARFNKGIIKLITIGLLLISIISIVISEIHTPKFTIYTQLEYDTIKIIDQLEGSFYMTPSFSSTSHPVSYYIYASIYNNISSPDGGIPFGTDDDYFEGLKDFKKYLLEKDCQNLISTMQFYNTTNLITYEEHCQTLKSCGLEEIETIEPVCAYKLNDKEIL